MNAVFRKNALASFFIARPVFAMVLAIATMLAGVLGIYSLSISQYPEVAPVTVRINASYPGATAEAVENSVTKKIEAAMTGLDGMLYMQSNSNTGSASISIIFDNSTDGDFAQVQVQNKVARITRQLPDAVQSTGVTVSRSSDSILMIGNLVSKDGRYTSSELADIMTTQIQDQVERIDARRCGRAGVRGRGQSRLGMHPKPPAVRRAHAASASAFEAKPVACSLVSLPAGVSMRG